LTQVERLAATESGAEGALDCVGGLCSPGPVVAGGRLVMGAAEQGLDLGRVYTALPQPVTYGCR
jgi:hypothetical protein